MSALDEIMKQGNDDAREVRSNWITCADGFRLSVVAGPGAYCHPRPSLVPGRVFALDVPKDYPGPYTEVEVGFPSARPEPWEPMDDPECWSKYAEDVGSPTETVYGYVPVALVRALVRMHGGEA